MKKAKIAAIIQARMGSSRFPGKVLRKLAGKPVLWHIIYRLRKSLEVDVIAIATTTSPKDDLLADFAVEMDVPLIRGSEDNVLERYWQAAGELEADVVVRVTGDAPLVDPEVLDGMIRLLITSGADYCTGDPETPSIHEGFSPFSRQALERLYREAFADPVAVEHVTAYFKEHQDSYKTVFMRLPEIHRFTGARISVDTPADLEFLEEVYRRLSVPAGEAEIKDVVALLEKDTSLLQINSRVKQKKATDRTRRVLFRCDGDEKTGMGHVVRCLALAEELRERHGLGAIFSVKDDREGAGMITEKGFQIEIQPEESHEGPWIDNLISRIDINALVLDVRTNLKRNWIRKWRERGILIITVDDPSDRRFEADFAFYPPAPNVKAMNWDGFRGQMFTGWEWVILRRAFSIPRDIIKPDPGRPLTVLVTMGGSDPMGLTLKAVGALDGLEGNFRTIVVLGKAFSRHGELADMLKSVRRPFEIHRDVQNMAQLMTQADLAVASFGVTAYELAAMGVPAVYLCLSKDHFRHAQVFEESGIAVNLGIQESVELSAIREVIGGLLSDEKKLSSMVKRTENLVDGKGAERIAEIISNGSVDADA